MHAVVAEQIAHFGLTAIDAEETLLLVFGIIGFSKARIFNAGVTVGSDFETMPETDWDWVMNINLNGVVNATRAFLPYLKQQPEAVLVNTSSIFGMIAVAKQSVYHTTKFAVRGFTEGLVREFKGSNLSVHCVHPGHIGTNIIKNSRFTETDDLTRSGGRRCCHL